MATCLKPYRHYTTVSVVGSAGRKNDQDKMSLEIFNKAVDKTIHVITEDLKLSLSSVRLVSGGAAWTDHIAVHLFINKTVPAVTLHLPAGFVTSSTKSVMSKSTVPCFEDSNRGSNPGRTTNTCHKLFSKAIGRNTLSEIQQAIDLGAEVKVHKGFYARNKYVAKSDKLIAFTWGDDPEKPTSGGTLHTWKHCKGQRIHIPYSTLGPELDERVSESYSVMNYGSYRSLKLTTGLDSREKQTGLKRRRSRELCTCSLLNHGAVDGLICIDDEEIILQQFDGFDIFSD